ncbi:MAG: hypothetical protein BroJett021_04100 [Chloroflexota bacterium]|nr:MAG: hypothetical protein BroJett021_04100 [Chloroflexota bacterium]
MKRSQGIMVVLMAVLFVFLTPRAAEAHQPYFEDEDWTPANAYRVKDPTVSTALYATLDRRDDVDYVRFTGRAGQSILIGLTIPQIEGQENFTPIFALIGPGLPATRLPARVEAPPDVGARILRAAPGEPTSFFEPFSRTRYWERQEDRFVLPADGEYLVAVWNEAGQVGRYTLVVGDREIPGGDIGFPFKLRAFWTPVPAPPEPTPRTCGR